MLRSENTLIDLAERAVGLKSFSCLEIKYLNNIQQQIQFSISHSFDICYILKICSVPIYL